VLLKHGEENIDRWDRRLSRTVVLPDCFVDLSIRMLVEQYVPEEWETLLMQTRGDDIQAGPQG
jgi:hypothetical protein